MCCSKSARADNIAPRACRSTHPALSRVRERETLGARDTFYEDYYRILKPDGVSVTGPRWLRLNVRIILRRRTARFKSADYRGRQATVQTFFLSFQFSPEFTHKSSIWLRPDDLISSFRASKSLDIGASEGISRARARHYKTPLLIFRISLPS